MPSKAEFIMWIFDLLSLLCAGILTFGLMRFCPWPKGVKRALVVWLFLFTQRYLFHRLFRTGVMSPDGMPNVVLIYLQWHAMMLWCSAFVLAVLVLVQRFWRRLSLYWLFCGSFVVGGMLAATMLFLGFFVHPRVEIYEVELEGLPAAAEGLRVVVLADLHIDQVHDWQWCEMMVDKVNALNPDLILFTGDQSDGGSELRAKDLEPLSRLRARHGAFAIGGNHEAWFDGIKLEQLLERYGIRSLNDKVVEVCGLSLIGVEDVRSLSESYADSHIGVLLEQLSPDAFPILLAHKPAVAHCADRLGVKLQLSGHTHGGQLPVMASIIARLNGGFVRGWYDLPHGMKLYVSPGCGVWNGFPYRLSRPEITLLVLKGKRQK
jgi:predicted MPP superfamily phosphohydrolase